MSYILDALKKSDQLRQSEAAPTLLTLQPEAAHASRPRPRWLHGALLAAVLTTMLLAGWLWLTPPANEPPAATANVPNTVAMSAALKPMAAPEIPVTPATSAPATLPTLDTTHKSAPTEAPQPASPQPAASVLQKAPLEATPIAVPTQTEAPLLTELPPALQTEIPKMTVAAHAYSRKPNASFVFVNDRMLHEQESLAPGLTLESITPDGMIFSYKGYRFRRGLQP